MHKKKDMKDCIKLAIEDIETFLSPYDYDVIVEDQKLDFIDSIKEDLKYAMQLQTAQEKLMVEFERLFNKAVHSRQLDNVISRRIDDIFENGLCIISKNKMYQYLDEESKCGYKAGRAMLSVTTQSTVEKYYQMALASKNKEAIELFEGLKRELL